MPSEPIDLDQLLRELRDLADVAVGLGVLGVQQTQVRRREIERRAAPLIERARQYALRARDLVATG